MISLLPWLFICIYIFIYIYILTSSIKVYLYYFCKTIWFLFRTWSWSLTEFQIVFVRNFREVSRKSLFGCWSMFGQWAYSPPASLTFSWLCSILTWNCCVIQIPSETQTTPRFFCKHADLDLIALLERTVPPIDLGVVGILRSAMKKYDQQVLG